jgi:hypothetical protein
MVWLSRTTSLMAAKTSGGPLASSAGQLAGAGHQSVGRQDLIDQAALMGLGHSIQRPVSSRSMAT